jgi:signal transduction histidine kinase
MLIPEQAGPVISEEKSVPLLIGSENILIVDDFPDIVELLEEFLVNQGLPVCTAGSVAEMRQKLEQNNVALVFLDIGLPDGSGIDLLPELTSRYPDMAIIMLTAVTDLHTALDCMRQGADDYMTKPVRFPELFSTVRKVLEKRRLMINNRLYQRQIEQANFRIRLLHELTMKMNTVYLSRVELDEILRAILVGITAAEGLGFNRAFLALFDETGEHLEGKLAIGPGCRDEAGRIWREMKEKDLSISRLIDDIRSDCFTSDAEVNQVIRSLKVSAADTDHILIRSCVSRKSMHVINGRAEYPVSPDLFRLLREDTFVIVPLYSPGRSLGVIIADHFVTQDPITADLIHALESFASQASLAIEHCNLYMAMENKIKELEAVSHELEKNKDLLVEAERYAALGHMSAQLVHNIRNPITSIGGTARLLARKTDDPELLKFLNMMTVEAEKIEATLKDLFSFVEQKTPNRETVPLYPLIRKSMILFYNVMQKQNIEHRLVLPEPDPTIFGDQHQIRQLLVHLIKNAVEAMPDGGTLAVTVRYDGHQIDITIQDTGTGLADRILNRATDPFFTTKTFGTGMGLTLVKRIARDHNGTLQLRNRDEGGTEATVSFLRHQETPHK